MSTPVESPSRGSAGPYERFNSLTHKWLAISHWRLFPALALFGALMFLASAPGCGGQGGGNQGHGGNAQSNQGRQGPKQPPIPVAITLARSGPIASYYTATATLMAEKEAEVLARATGVAETLGCEEGDVVNKGSVLLQIDNDEYLHRLRQAEANTASLADRYKRLEGMFEQQLVSAEEFEAARNELKAAEAAEALARLDLSYTTVEAPFAGRVVRRLVDVGQNVSVGTPLFVVSDFDPLLAVVHVPSKEFKKLRPDQPVQLVLDSNQKRLQGRIKLVSPIIDPASGTIKITIEVPEYPPDTRPGDFAEVLIVTEQREGRILVPKNAVFTDRGDRIVYVAADSTAERRVVETGFEDDTHAEILSGVTEGDSVVVKGQRSLKHGALIKILEDNPLGASDSSKSQTDELEKNINKNNKVGDKKPADDKEKDDTRDSKTDQVGS